MSVDFMPIRFLNYGQPSDDPVSTVTRKGNDLWCNHTDSLQNCLESLEVSCDSKDISACDNAFDYWKQMTVELREKGHIIYMVGNGASASMASHFSADLAKNAHVHTQVFTDLALITAVANDLSYDQIFVEPLRRRLTPNDMLVAISSSGNSPNVVNACRFASEVGASVVTVTAMGAENKMRQIGDLNFWIPAQTYGMAETGHACILHYWMDSVSI